MRDENRTSDFIVPGEGFIAFPLTCRARVVAGRRTMEANVSVEKQGGPELVKTIVGEIAAMEYAGDVKAIGAVIIDRDGDCRIMIAYSEGTKLAAIAGSLILQHNLLGELNMINKTRD